MKLPCLVLGYAQEMAAYEHKARHQGYLRRSGQHTNAKFLSASVPLHESTILAELEIEALLPAKATSPTYADMN